MGRKLYDRSGNPINFYATVAVAYIQPAIGATVDVTVDDASLFVRGGWVTVGGNFYRVQAIDYNTNVLTLLNSSLVQDFNAVPTTVIAALNTMGVAGPPIASITTQSDFLVAGTKTFTFLNVTNDTTARVSVSHGDLNASPALGFPTYVQTNPAPGTVQVVVTSRDAAAAAVVTDVSEVVVTLDDAP